MEIRTVLAMLLQGAKRQRPGLVGRLNSKRFRGEWGLSSEETRGFLAITTTDKAFIPSLYNDHYFNSAFLDIEKVKLRDTLPRVSWHMNTCLTKPELKMYTVSHTI